MMFLVMYVKVYYYIYVANVEIEKNNFLDLDQKKKLLAKKELRPILHMSIAQLDFCPLFLPFLLTHFIYLLLYLEPTYVCHKQQQHAWQFLSYKANNLVIPSPNPCVANSCLECWVRRSRTLGRNKSSQKEQQLRISAHCSALSRYRRSTNTIARIS